MTIPFVLFASFQLMFAAITPALITGAFAERKRFGSFVLFTILWSILVYSPIAHWVWSADGWLFKLGALDFAGGTVVHISSGVSALVVALIIGRRAHQRRQHGAARHPDDRPRRGPAVVRLVRLQRRLRGRRQRPRRQRLHRHQHRRRGGHGHLGPRQLPPHAQGQRRRGRLRRGRRPRRDHPGIRLRHRRVARSSSASSPAACATAPRSCGPAPASTTRSTSSRSTAWAACSAPSPPASSPPPRSRPPTRACSTATRSSWSPSSSPSRRHVAYAAVGTFVIVKVVDLVLGLRVGREGRGGRPRPRGPRRGGLPGLTPAARCARRAVSQIGRRLHPAADWESSMTRDGAPQRQTRNRRRREPPLYDARYEHDACGVGFVADAGGRVRRSRPRRWRSAARSPRSSRRVRRGRRVERWRRRPPPPDAVARAPRRSPTGIGRRPAGRAHRVPPRPADARGPAAARARSSPRRGRRGPRRVRLARVPVDSDALGREAAASLPDILQALVPAARRRCPTPTSSCALACARRGPTRRPATPASTLRVVSASSRTVVYKGLVAGGRLAELFPDLRRAGRRPVRAVPPALRHEHPARVVARPAVRVRRPQRRDQHRPRQPRADPRPARRRGRPAASSGAADRLRAAGPLLSPGVSDSPRSTRRWSCSSRPAGRSRPRCSALVPEAPGLRRTPQPAVAAFRRRVAGSWRRGTARARSCSATAAASARCSTATACGRRPGRSHRRPGGRRRVRGGRRAARRRPRSCAPAASAPGELLLVDPAAGRVLTDADAKSWVLRRLPLHDAPRAARRRPTGPVAAVAATVHAGARRARDRLRYLVGLDAESCASTCKTMALDAPRAAVEHGRRHAAPGAAGSTGPSPTTSARRSPRSRTRRSTRSASGPSWTSRWSSAAGRRSCDTPRGPRTVRLGGRSSSTSTGCSARVRGRSRAPHRAVRRLDATWAAADGPAASRPPSIGSPPARRRRRPGGTEVLVLSDAAASLGDRRGCPSRPSSPAGAVHAALTEAGLRGRTDIVVDAGGRPRRPRRSRWSSPPAPPGGPSRLRRARRASSPARAAPRTLTAEDAVGNLLAALEAGLRKVLARMGISTVASYVGGQLFETLELGPARRRALLPGRGRVARPARGRRPRRRPAPRLEEARALAAAARPHRLPDPGFARFRGDGELHMYSPAERAGAHGARRGDDPATGVDAALATYRDALGPRRGARSATASACGAARRRRRCRSTRSRTRARSRAASSCRR